MPDQTLVFDVSAHGLGHLAQTGPVIDCLLTRRPALKIVVRSRHPRQVLARFMRAPFETSPPPPEVGMAATSAMTLDLEASANGYNQLHRDWGSLIDREAAKIASLWPSLVISNINYVTLAAAQFANVPNIAFCCINWLDIYRFYLSHQPNAAKVVQEIYGAYSACDLFIQPTPHMPMTEMPWRQSVGPIARRGANRAPELRNVLRVGPSTKLVLLTLGGFPSPHPIVLPTIDNLHWLSRDADESRSDVSAIEKLDFPFLDLVASVDVVVGKDSYGTVTEAACAGIPLVMIPRPDWPESPRLIEWAAANCNFAAVYTGLEDRVGLKKAVCEVLDKATPPAIEPSGISEVTSLIEAQLDRGSLSKS
jgi:hypothetical protein